jgi:acyl-CoA synthetase (AMP-forming)/AMP-acid ligase II
VAGARLLEVAGLLAGGLAALGPSASAPSGRPVLLFLPNTPTWPMSLLAVLAAGRQPLLVDPRASRADLEPLIAEAAPDLAITLDIGAVLDKLMRLLPAVPEMQVRVARFAPELPFPRNLLFPLLRGGGLANLPQDPRFARLEGLQGAAPDPDAAWSGPLLTQAGPLAQASVLADADALQAQAGGETEPRWLLGAPLATAEGLAALFAALTAPATLLLSPRLDGRSLDKLARQGRPTRRLPD